MAVPFRRTSKTAKRLRRGHFKLHVTGMVACPHCGALIQAHHVCPECGYYNGKDVLHLSKEKGEPAKKK
ncbi:MAG: 50S ribosomal protein L32 [Bacilli bacterium]|jgi:large subunit ribosomal protein L32|nr:50S ribosomal protein L32 [Bacilli bacterium]MCI2111318.1 50S ribosomal protein L32 [Bacilli bacterium]